MPSVQWIDSNSGLDENSNNSWLRPRSCDLNNGALPRDLVQATPRMTQQLPRQAQSFSAHKEHSSHVPGMQDRIRGGSSMLPCPHTQQQAPVSWLGDLNARMKVSCEAVLPIFPSDTDHEELLTTSCTVLSDPLPSSVPFNPTHHPNRSKSNTILSRVCQRHE